MSEIPVKYYNNAGPKTDDLKGKWWGVEATGKAKRDRAYHVFETVESIWDYQKYRETNNIRYARLYHNMEMVSLRAGMFARTASSGVNVANRVTLNVIKSCVDTVASKIAKNKPRPMFLTADGSWALQRKAKLLTKYLEGLFDFGGAYTEGKRSFVDSCVWGTGVMKIYSDPDKAKICFERIIPDEIIVDETEGRYQKPRQIFQLKLMFREVVTDMFPEFASEIKMAQSGLSAEEQRTCAADMIKVVEAWHLPSSTTSGDGRHSICVENCTLLDEEYTKDYFPFVFQRWTNKLLGFYGMGLAEELIGIQLEINKILRNIQLAQHLMAVPQVWLEANSHVVKAHVNNEFGGIKNYVGTPPIFMVPQAMSPEVYQHLWQLYQKSFEITGVSQLSASSVKPSGVTAAVALREMSDIETERFMLTAQSQEDFYMDAAYIAIDQTRDLYEMGNNVTAKIKDGKFMRQIKWSEVDIDEDMYSMRIFPTSLLPSQPAGKLQKVQELMQAGFLDKDESLSLLDFPDTDKAVSLKTAARENIIRMIDAMLDEGKPQTVEPYMNIQLALQLSQNAYNEAKMQNAPQGRLDLLMNFMNDCGAKIAPQVAQMQMGQTPDMSPQASPQAPPQSELLPYGGAAQGQAPAMAG